MEIISEIINNDQNYKYASQFLSYAGEISQYRALVFALMSGDNSFEVTEHALQSGCNRFGLDSPVPIITKRLALYGNEENIDKQLENAAKKLGMSFLDPGQYTDIQPDKSIIGKPGTEEASQMRERPLLRDM